jgi:hypothetical protein
MRSTWAIDDRRDRLAGPPARTRRPLTVHASLIGPSDPEWTRVLSWVRHDFYHLPGFVDFATQWQEPGAPLAFVAIEGDAVFAVPLIVRPIAPDLVGEDGWFDATGPHGYPGPITGPAGTCDDTFIRRAAGALIEVLRERRIMNAFVRCHPLLSPPIDLLRREGDIVERGETVSIDLTRSPEETWSGFRENHRRAITRARRDGYAMRVDVSWERLDEFLAIRDVSMEQHGAAARWRIPREYVTGLQAAIGSRLHLCVVEQDDELAAGAVVTEVDGIVEYHLAATALGHAAESPTKLLIEEVSRWARDRDNRVFHLAGSLHKDDALIHFKHGFSPLRHPVASWQVIADLEAHQRAIAHWEQVVGLQLADGDDGDFFPAYRGPQVPATRGDLPG